MTEFRKVLLVSKESGITNIQHRFLLVSNGSSSKLVLVSFLSTVLESIRFVASREP